tara:strand:- start:166 stop:618 length:453 start_codon:yes stop_codon:yes gene_type:complete
MDNVKHITPQPIIDNITRLNVSYKDIIGLLKQLTSTPMMQKQHYLNIINNLPHNHFIFVLMLNDTPIGMITLFIEQKIIHNGGKVGHIEDLVVDKKYRKKGYASLLISHVVSIAKLYNCYKCILNCNDDNISIYQKNGFTLKDNGMVNYF